jgi:hypothetical protein
VAEALGGAPASLPGAFEQRADRFAPARVVEGHELHPRFRADGRTRLDQHDLVAAHRQQRHARGAAQVREALRNELPQLVDPPPPESRNLLAPGRDGATCRGFGSDSHQR